MWQDYAVADGEVWRGAASELNNRGKRLRLTLGVIGVAAAGAIAGILTSGFHGAAVHTVVTPAALGSYTWVPDLAENMPALTDKVATVSSGQASDIRARTYEKPAAGGIAPQLLMVIGGHLTGTSPASSITTLTHLYPSAHVVPAGPMGGSAACFEEEAGTAASVAICAWFDNDSFGILASPTLSGANLATLMVQDRPLIELVKK
jgi:hypothetical protein